MSTARAEVNEVLHKKAFDFFEKIFNEIKLKNILLKESWLIDHLCYRVATFDEYTQMKQHLQQMGQLLIESEVNGRPILTYKLHKPFHFFGFRIPLIELPAPKPSKPCQTGFEHLEVVCDLPFTELKKQLLHVKTDLSGLNKSFNQEFEVKLDAGAIKYHHLSLESVVEIEKKSTVYHAIEASKILSDFKKYQPLLAGTFPLGLEQGDSDLDFLFSCADLNTLKAELKDSYGTHSDFKIEEKIFNAKKTLVCRFTHNGFPFEIFAQDCASVEQTGYQHYLIEERLLSLGGKNFRNKVQNYRKLGLKTEPAFAKALNLDGDPYEALLELRNVSQQKLVEIYF